MHFLLGHEINHPSSFQDKGCGIINKLVKEKGESEKYHPWFFLLPMENSIVSIQLKAQEQNRRFKPMEYRCSFPPHRDPHRKRKTYTSLLRDLTSLRSVLSSPFTFFSCKVTTQVVGYLLE